jgi:hypothetical protein
LHPLESAAFSRRTPITVIRQRDCSYEDLQLGTAFINSEGEHNDGDNGWNDSAIAFAA